MGVLQRDEWLVGRGYLSAESISLALTSQADHTDKEIKEEMPALQAARAANDFTDELSAALLHHFPGLDCGECSRALPVDRTLPDRYSAPVP